MKKTKLYIIAACLATASVVGVAVASQSGRLGSFSAKPSTHDDGHHDADTQDIGELVDLTNQREVTMDIKDFSYSRPNIKIKKGTKVTWTNQEIVRHNVMKEHEGAEAAHDAPTAAEVKPDVFAGPLLAKGESYSFVFNVAGEYSYHCAPHPFMKGSIAVIE